VAKAIGDDDAMTATLRAALYASPANSAADEANLINTTITGVSSSTPAPKPTKVEIRTGLFMTQHPDGKITLEGAMLKDRAALGRLKDLLKKPF